MDIFRAHVKCLYIQNEKNKVNIDFSRLDMPSNFQSHLRENDITRGADLRIHNKLMELQKNFRNENSFWRPPWMFYFLFFLQVALELLSVAIRKIWVPIKWSRLNKINNSWYIIIFWYPAMLFQNPVIAYSK